MSHIQVTQVKSGIGKPERQRRTLQGLGLRKIRHTVKLQDTPAIRGMIEKVQHLVEVQVFAEDLPKTGKRHNG